MDIWDFTSDQLLANIKEILENDTFKDRCDHVAAIVADQPMTAQETAVYWIEHVMKFGGDHLKSHALTMPWYEFYMLDLLAVFTLIIIVLAVVVYAIVHVLCTFCKSKSKQD